MRKDYKRKNDKNRKSQGKPRGKAPKINADLWGYHAVYEAWLNPQRTVKNLYLTENTVRGFEDALQLAQKKGLSRPEPKILDKKSFDRGLKNAVHQGIALECDPLPEIFVQDLIARTELNNSGFLVMLDQVTDPHNVGAILRSASAFGADGIIMQSRHSPQITGVLAKTACGAAEHVPVTYETNLGRAIEQLREAGYIAVAFDEHAETSIAEVTPHNKFLLILGAEGKGLRPSLREQSDMLVRLPTEGPIQSLNVSNAAAVGLYALARIKS